MYIFLKRGKNDSSGNVKIKIMQFFLKKDFKNITSPFLKPLMSVKYIFTIVR